jgi:hypothetical protein
MNVDSVEKEPAHPRALARVMDGEVLQFRRGRVLVENIETLSAMLRIRDCVQPEMLDVFFLEPVDLP